MDMSKLIMNFGSKKEKGVGESTSAVEESRLQNNSVRCLERGLREYIKGSGIVGYFLPIGLSAFSFSNGGHSYLG
jgi:hypothetical protein